ncbi:plexin-B-like isoform X2 [Physella acuta]|uniref:plexin-B-like isoform X2 n=1 Tax=Physella acuta TaxID=109671 RepID=UPI0027DE44DB|nr:plexin-B-like isoform X2 [Physella acuta]
MSTHESNSNSKDDNDFLCNTNELESFSNIVGTSPVIRHPVAVYPGLKLTSLAASVVNQFTVAFVGTETGTLKKILLTRDRRSHEYAEVTVAEGHRILPDMMFDASQKHIYVMTDTNVTKIPVETCGQADSCNSCISDGDPYCGWCFLEKKCVLKESCANSEDPTQSRWLHGNAAQCINIAVVSPTAASVSSANQLHLTITNLPTNSLFSCVFLELDWSTPASFWYFGTTCNTPDFTQTGLSLGTAGFRTVTLALNSSETGKLFVTKSFTFYNCSSFRSCSSCTNSSFECDWCVYENACFDDTRTCQSDIIRGKTSTTRPGRHGALHCPQIDTKVTKDIYIPVGVEKTVILRGYNIPELRSNMINHSYKCIIDTGTERKITPAKRYDDKSLSCDIPAMNYPANVGTFEANLSVYWGNNFWLESTSKLFVTLYKCDVLASNECSMCVNLNYTRPYLQCYWCQNSCTYSSSCKQHASITCPAPHIEAVWPLSGPIQGGTNVTISGTNLGTKFDDIEKAITVANVACIPFRELYSPSKKIVCITGWRGQVAEGPVVIKLDRSSNQFHTNFKYKSPRIEDIEPTMGPKSGGSRLTIKGRDMDTGGHFEASLGDVPCIVDREKITNSSLECITSKVWHPDYKTPIKVYFDEKEYSLNRNFVYKEDPTINRIAPLASILEGGRTLTVTGTDFLTVQQPKMFAYVPTINGDFYPTNSTICKVMNDNVMKCPTPPLVDSLKNIIRSKRNEQVERTVSVPPVKIVQLGFVMDGVMAVRNLSTVPSLKYQLEYFTNPRIFNFTEPNGIKTLKGDALIIEGADLNTAVEKYEVSVMIGNSPCNVTTFSQSQIVCKLPSTQPSNSASGAGDKDRKTLPYVKVKINNLEFHVGRVEYDVPETFTFPTEAIAGIAAGGGFLVLVIVLILIIYRRQSTKAERIYRKLQIQLDNLESNVRNECKQAFAELQTDMTDLTGDLISSGIPFWDFHSYTFKVLFPGMTDHIILHPPIQKNGRFQFSDHGLQLFHQLLGKKLFMVTFIRTLEEQRAFSIRDRANVASLLMIVYLNNMEYATDILKCLLVDLVHKSVEGRHPKLMLRRSESVVEKLLTNWLSICLYKYLRDHAGASLFMLYKAIKLQAEKGPVDAVTGDARYSLSEDTLLREKIEPRILTLNIENGGEIFQVRIPDCDTITQSKEKILDHMYKNIPFSQRPHVRDLELEWRNGPTGPLMLTDIDIASHNKDGWRRLNTLSFYRVHDGAYMSLLHRQQTVKCMNGSVSPILKKDQETGFKEWHLVKHEDTLIKDGGVKMISEIFLTRLLSTKGTLQKYVDDFFKNMLCATPYVPPVIKYLFDFLDSQADAHDITDYEVVHTWKCNSLPLRFWVNIIKNPDFVFDINKPRIVDSCLSVVAQTFMDSCSTSEHRLGKDSPSNKLLFAKDIVHYRKLVEKYFTDIREQPPMSDQEMNAFLADISRTSPKLFYISSALGELYKYVSKYKNELMEALDQDNQASAQQLSCKLGHIVSCMEGPSGNMAYV